MAAPGKRLTRIYERAPVFVQNLMSSAYGLKKLREERSSAFWRIYRELEETQWWSRERLREMQIQRLQETLRFAQEHVRFYGMRFAEYGVSWDQVDSVQDLQRFPLLTKDDIRSHKNELIADVKTTSKVIKQSTSGTTGSPLEVLMSRETLLTERAWIRRHRTWAGYDSRSWRGTFGGYRIVPVDQDKPPFWRTNLPWRQVHFSTFHMSEKNLAYYAKALRTGRVRFLDGYPSALYVMARYLVLAGETIPMKAIFTGSEPLYGAYRDTIETAFACKVFDYYEMTEKVTAAGECDRHSGYHVCMEHVVCEIVPHWDKDTSPDGALGELVGTSLVNRVMPLIRYCTGDVVFAAPDGCSCDRGLETIGPVETKAEDIVVCADGRLISASNLTYPFKPIRSIRESQIVQESPTDVVVRIVRRPDYTTADEQNLLNGIRECLGPSMNVRAEYVEEIPRTAVGKFRFVVRKVGSDLLDSPHGRT